MLIIRLAAHDDGPAHSTTADPHAKVRPTPAVHPDLIVVKSPAQPLCARRSAVLRFHAHPPDSAIHMAAARALVIGFAVNLPRFPASPCRAAAMPVISVASITIMVAITFVAIVPVIALARPINTEFGAAPAVHPHAARV